MTEVGEVAIDELEIEGEMGRPLEGCEASAVEGEWPQEADMVAKCRRKRPGCHVAHTRWGMKWRCMRVKADA